LFTISNLSVILWNLTYDIAFTLNLSTLTYNNEVEVPQSSRLNLLLYEVISR
jgi:hypothetical protein